MSSTNHLECDTCKESVWIGQRDYIYSPEPDLRKLEAFLEKHVGHTLAYRKSYAEKYMELSRFMDGQDEWTEFE